MVSVQVPNWLALRHHVGVRWLALALVVASVPAAAQVQLPPQSTPSIIGPGMLLPDPVPAMPSRPEGPLVEGQGIQIPVVPGRGGSATFTLSSLEIPESHFLTAAELAQVATRWVGRDIGFDDLQRIVAEINALYQDKGVTTASAVLPPQRIEGGKVRIQLVEGVLSGVEVGGNSYTDTGYIRDRIGGEEGEVLDGAAMHRKLLRFNLTNDAQVRAALRPGQSFGLTDVVLSVVEPPRNGLDLSLDNHAFENTGRAQGGVFARRNSLLMSGDRLSLYANRSRGTSTANGSFNLPVGQGGARVGAGMTFSRTKIMKGEFRDLDVEGWSRAFNANASQPVWTGDRAMVSLIGSAQKSLSVNTIANVTISQMAVTKGQIGLSAYWGGEATSLMGTQIVGPAYVTSELDGEGRRITLWNGSLTARQHLTGPLSAQLTGAWQFSPAWSLPGDQVFQLGGASTMRGVMPGTMVGDSGGFGQAELHVDLSSVAKGLDVFGFYDMGFTEPTDRESTVMSDMGIGMSWRIADRVTTEATFSRRLRDISETDLERHRLFLRAIVHIL